MTKKVVLDDVSSGYVSTAKLNENFNKIEDEFEKVLYRNNDLGEDNTMLGDLDMNSNSLFNVGSIGLSDGSFSTRAELIGPAGADSTVPGPASTVPGPQGENGATWYNGTGVPTGGTGLDDDYYIDNDTSLFYKKIASVWIPQGSFKGIQGDPGVAGSITVDGTLTEAEIFALTGATPGVLYDASDSTNIYMTDTSGTAQIISQKFATPEMYGVIGVSAAQDTAALQAAHDNNNIVIGTGTYLLENFRFRGANKTVDLRNSKINNNSTTGIHTVVMEGGAESSLDLGICTNAVGAGHLILVDGVCRDSQPTWQEARINNPLSSALYADGDSGAGLFGWNKANAFSFTKGVANDLHEVPLIDIKTTNFSVAQGNTFNFNYAYGSKYVGGTDSIPFMSLKATGAALLAQNDVNIIVGEKLAGGGLHTNRVVNSDFKVRAFDTTDWVGDIIRSTAGRNNVFKVIRKEGVRTSTDYGSGAVLPFDVNTNDQSPFIFSSGLNGAAGTQYIDVSSSFAPLLTNNVYCDVLRSATTKILSESALAQCGVSSVAAIRAGTNLNVTSVANTSTGVYDVYLDNPLPYNYYPIQLTIVTTSITDIDLVGNVMYDTGDKTHFTVVITDAGVLANKGFSFTII